MFQGVLTLELELQPHLLQAVYQTWDLEPIPAGTPVNGDRLIFIGNQNTLEYFGSYMRVINGSVS